MAEHARSSTPTPRNPQVMEEHTRTPTPTPRNSNQMNLYSSDILKTEQSTSKHLTEKDCAALREDPQLSNIAKPHSRTLTSTQRNLHQNENEPVSNEEPEIWSEELIDEWLAQDTISSMLEGPLYAEWNLGSKFEIDHRRDMLTLSQKRICSKGHLVADAESVLKASSNVMPSKKETLKCNCKKSECLKFYCNCFAALKLCTTECGCESCLNLEGFEERVKQARKRARDRNSEAFIPKVKRANTNIEGSHTIGCNCRNSRCKKSYCECFKANVLCSPKCKCLGCENNKKLN